MKCAICGKEMLDGTQSELIIGASHTKYIVCDTCQKELNILRFSSDDNSASNKKTTENN